VSEFGIGHKCWLPEQYQNYHRLLNRAVWSELELSRILFGLLVSIFGGETIVQGADDTLERRLGG